ncbi:MAG: hypothetical protein H6729_07275 [Deltaproteobacteria bacterium]|nr:hypothetical protein [Deltaproteobacteria bacterium]
MNRQATAAREGPARTTRVRLLSARPWVAGAAVLAASSAACTGTIDGDDAPRSSLNQGSTSSGASDAGSGSFGNTSADAGTGAQSGPDGLPFPGPADRFTPTQGEVMRALGNDHPTAVSILASILCAGCSGTIELPPAIYADVPILDAGIDGGLDADATGIDAANTVTDASVVHDAGVADSSVAVDSGLVVIDGGPTADSGTVIVDSGVRDASSPDTGAPDSGSGGPDAGSGTDASYPPSTTFSWTELNPSADSRSVYVSSSGGNDANDCLSESHPCRSIQQGLSRLRDGFPDWLMLKRGDVWYEGITAPGQSWTMSGRSQSEPMVITAYGDSGPRPLLKTGYEFGFWRYTDNDIHDFALVGIHFKAHTRDPYSSEYQGRGNNEVQAGFRWTGGGDIRNILIEGCKFEFYSSNFVMHASNGQPMFENVQVRGNVLYSAWSGSNTYAQGMFVDKIKGLLVEGNVFDRNGGLIGYDGDPNGIVPSDVTEQDVAVTWWDHQAYINSFNTDVVVVNNIFAGGDGCQMRAGGLAMNNLFTRAINSLDVGVASSPTPGGVSGQVLYNVFLEGVDFPANGRTPGPRANGIQVANIKSEGGLVVEHNILANDRSAQYYGRAIRLNGTNCGDHNEPCAVHNVTFRQNVVYNWRGGFQTFGVTGTEIGDITVEDNMIQNPRDTQAYLVHLDGGYTSNDFFFSGNRYYRGGGATWVRIGRDEVTLSSWLTTSHESDGSALAPAFPDPTRSLGQYNALHGGASTHEDFLARAREQSPYNWNPDLEATTINAWFREGFGVTGP